MKTHKLTVVHLVGTGGRTIKLTTANSCFGGIMQATQTSVCAYINAKYKYACTH